MIYALNVYDIIPGKEAVYAEYIEKAGPLAAGLNVRVVAAGQNPLRELSGQSRNHFVVAGFPDLAAFDSLMAALRLHDLHRLREAATENYIWTVYEAWGLSD